MIKIYRSKACWLKWLIPILFFTSLDCKASMQDSSSVTIHVSNMPIEMVFRQIEKQTGYSFYYSKSTLDGDENISASFDRATLAVAMNIILKGKSIVWQLKDGGIILYKKSTSSSKNIDSIPKVNVSGRIVDPQGSPIPGATVTVKGQGRGMSTDDRGRFEFKILPVNSLISISSIGYETKQIRVSGENSLIISLDTLIREIVGVDVVSTGYQDIPKERATGSFVQIDNKTINRSVSTNILDRIIDVTSSLKSEKGGRSNISIRGFSTINANMKPLVVIDGFPYDENPDEGNILLNNINPNDIESITILRDAASASIWGARAGNGVIVVKTKKGRFNNKMNIQLNTNLNFIEKPKIKSLRIISSKDAVDLEKIRYAKGLFNDYDDIYPSSGYFPSLSTVTEILLAQRRGELTKDQADHKLDILSQHDVRDDVNKYLIQEALNQQYNLNISGGSNINSYYGSIGVDKNISNSVGDNSKRFSLRFDNTFRPIKKLEFNTYINYTQTTNRNNSVDYNQFMATGTSMATPYTQLIDDNGNPLHVPMLFTYRTAYIDTISTPGLLDWHYRPLEELNNTDNESKNYSARLGGAIRYNIINSLSLEMKGQYEKRIGFVNSLSNLRSYTTRDLINTFMYTDVSGKIVYPIPRGSFLSTNSIENTLWNIRGQLNFNREWIRHQVNAIVGYEASESKSSSNRSRKYGYDVYTLNTISNIDYKSLFSLRPNGNKGSGNIPNDDYLSGNINRFESYFGNIGYTYNNRYNITISARIDKSNFLGAKENQRMVPLGSAGFGWNISEENFYNQKWLPYFRLRATYGYSGNLNNKATALPTALIYTSVGSSYHNEPYLSLQTPPNPGLTWEKIGITNFGIDFRALNNRIDGSIEYYLKKGENLIGGIISDPTTGTNRYIGNYASMRGSGVDLILNSVNLNKGVTWKTNFLLSYNTDRVTDYLPEGITVPSAIPGSNTPIVGKPIMRIYSFPFAGLNPENGDPRGFVDGQIVDYSTVNQKVKLEDLMYHGSTTPRLFGSLINSFSYRKLSVSFNITYKFGYYFKKSTISYTSLFSNYGGHSDYGIRWKNPGDEKITTVPSLPDVANAIRDRFYASSSEQVQKGDHIRLQDIRVSYEINKDIIKRFPLSNVVLFMYAGNLGVIWRANKFGLDPSIGENSVPIPKSLAAGLTINF